MLNDDEEVYDTEDEECHSCGHILDSCGYCVNTDCPYNELLQNEEIEED